MLKHGITFSVLILIASQAAAGEPTRMLAMPAAHGDRIAFAYDDDLWLGKRDGGPARRITRADGQEINPTFSPDGKWLAFSAPYDGNHDVYVMPAAGGVAKRLTWHPGNDVVRGFTPDSRAILFQTERTTHTRRHRRLFTVAIDGGVPEQLPVPTGFKAALSPDGRYLAYSPLAERFGQWKNYRGGTTSRIWILDLADLSVTEVPRSADRANDTDPMWIGKTLYFNSDRNGEFNLYKYLRDIDEVTQLTELVGFPVLEPNTDGRGRIVFEQAGWLHEYDVDSARLRKLTISAPTDLAETRSRRISGSQWIHNAGPAPDLSRVALEYRGEIVTVPADKGDPRQITNSSGVADRSPVWSPDGERIAWFSDAGGEYALMIATPGSNDEPERIAVDGAGFYDHPVWSPNGRYIAYRDNSQSLYVLDIERGRTRHVASEPVYTPLNMMSMDWSPDSRWLAYTVQNEGLISTVYAWSVDKDTSIRITDGLSEMADPVFDPNGNFLYVLASTDAGPLKDWFSQNSLDMQVNYGVYAVTLAADGPHPLPPQSDEVKLEDDSGNGDNENDDPPRVIIDEQGIGDRIIALPLPKANRRHLRVGASGELYWLESGNGETSFEAFSTPATLVRYTLEARDPGPLAEKVSAFYPDRDGKKMLYRIGNDWYINNIGDELPTDSGKLDLDAVAVTVDPPAEWRQILHEAWRVNRDYFYDPGFHGANWEAVRDKYEDFLPHLATRRDLDRVITWMLSELSVGHSYLTTGDYPEQPDNHPAGLLGADFEIDQGRYRFARVFGGLNWNPDLRAPLKAPGVNVAAGEYLLAVNGKPVRPPDNVYRPFVDQIDRQVTLTIAGRPDGRDAREVTVLPIADEGNLRYLDWLESNLEYVAERTDGRVAYVHVPNTAGAGHEMFKRYFYPQSHKQALILDERYNGGGLVADYYIDILRRDYIAHWNFRYGEDLITPRGAILGPKVLIVNETAGSGGDLLPWMFRKFNLGPIIGKRTWGGLVGILGFPSFIDGGGVTAPNLAFWTEEDGFAVENEGVPPDIEVEQWPKAIAEGRDPQLDRAIEEVMELLEKNPPMEPERPDYPDRAVR